jgi:hypothetical protein
MLAIASRFFACPGMGNPVGGDADDIGALQGAEPIALGEPAVVADEGPDTTYWRLEDGEAEVARLEEQVLLVPEVVLPELSDEA